MNSNRFVFFFDDVIARNVKRTNLNLLCIRNVRSLFFAILSATLEHMIKINKLILRTVQSTLIVLSHKWTAF